MSEYERIWENEVAELRAKIERLRDDKVELLAALWEIVWENPSRSPIECARAAIDKVSK